MGGAFDTAESTARRFRPSSRTMSPAFQDRLKPVPTAGGNCLFPPWATAFCGTGFSLCSDTDSITPEEPVRRLFLACPLLVFCASLSAAEQPDLTKQPTLYVVGYAHLDTQWRWEYPRTIGEFIPKTMHDNFALFEKYPHYVFNFSGANRYRMMKEYYPADYAKVQQYVAAGRWFPAGSSMEEGDVNSPSAESIVRQILYGSQYFRHEFGKTSAEYMLPDCFGFPASLPSILAHMGIRGFSTQKLTWGSAARVGGPGSIENTPVGIPFNVGFWEGPDGRGVIAAFNPGSYGGQVREDISKSPIIADPNARNNPIDWPGRVALNGKV